MLTIEHFGENKSCLRKMILFRSRIWLGCLKDLWSLAAPRILPPKWTYQEFKLTRRECQKSQFFIQWCETRKESDRKVAPHLENCESVCSVPGLPPGHVEEWPFISCPLLNGNFFFPQMVAVVCTVLIRSRIHILTLEYANCSLPSRPLAEHHCNLWCVKHYCLFGERMQGQKPLHTTFKWEYRPTKYKASIHCPGWLALCLHALPQERWDYRRSPPKLVLRFAFEEKRRSLPVFTLQKSRALCQWHSSKPFPTPIC